MAGLAQLALDGRSGGGGFDSWGLTNTQGLRNNREMKVLPLLNMQTA